MPRIAFTSAYLGLGVVLGYISAGYILDRVGSVNVLNSPGWQEWQLDQNAASSSYALARFLTAGRLPPASNQNKNFFRVRDDDANSLSADCSFTFKGALRPGRWWSIALINGDTPDSGGNPVLTADHAVTLPDGSLTIRISKYPQPGNWLKPMPGSDFVLHYTVNGVSADEEVLALPSLKRDGC